jgi:hypothetical protein
LPLKEDEWIIPETLSSILWRWAPQRLVSSPPPPPPPHSLSCFCPSMTDRRHSLWGPERVGWERIRYGIIYGWRMYISRGRLLVATYLFFAILRFLTKMRICFCLNKESQTHRPCQ